MNEFPDFKLFLYQCGALEA